MTPCWVTRDKGPENSAGYAVYFVDPSKRYTFLDWFGKSRLFTNDSFEMLTGFRLSPGEGPVKVRISVKKCK